MSIKAGNVFAATGDKGIIYKITPDGKGTVFYATKATHAMTLAFDRDGQLLAGTESPGRVFRLDASGKPFVLLDSSYNEIHTLRVDSRGNIYVAAVGGRGPSGGGRPRPGAFGARTDATHAKRLHRDHRRRGWRCRCHDVTRRAGAIRTRRRNGDRCAVSDPARRRVGPAVGITRGHTV